MKQIFKKIMALVLSIAVFSLSAIDVFAGVYSNTYEMFKEDTKWISIDNQFIYANSDSLFSVDSELSKWQLPTMNEESLSKYYKFAIIQHNKYRNALRWDFSRDYEKYSYAFSKKLDTQPKRLQVISNLTTSLSKIDKSLSSLESPTKTCNAKCLILKKQKYNLYKNLFLAVQYELKALVVLNHLEKVEELSQIKDEDYKKIYKAFLDLESAVKNEAEGIWNAYKFDFPSYYSESDFSLATELKQIWNDWVIKMLLSFSDIKYSKDKLKEYLTSDFDFNLDFKNPGSIYSNSEINTSIKWDLEFLSNIKSFIKVNSFEVSSSDKSIDQGIKASWIENHLWEYIALFTQQEEVFYNSAISFLTWDNSLFDFQSKQIFDENMKEVRISKKLENWYILNFDNELDIRLEFDWDMTLISIDEENYGEKITSNFKYSSEDIYEFTFNIDDLDKEDIYWKFSYTKWEWIKYEIQDEERLKWKWYIDIKNYKLWDFDFDYFVEDYLDLDIRGIWDNISGSIHKVNKKYSYYSQDYKKSKVIVDFEWKRDWRYWALEELWVEVVYDAELSNSENAPVYGTFNYEKWEELDLSVRWIPWTMIDVDTDMNNWIIDKFKYEVSVLWFWYSNMYLENGKVKWETKIMNQNVVKTTWTYTDDSYDIVSSFSDDEMWNFKINISKETNTSDYKEEHKLKIDFSSNTFETEGFVEFFYWLKQLRKWWKVNIPEIPTEYKYIDEIY